MKSEEIKAVCDSISQNLINDLMSNINADIKSNLLAASDGKENVSPYEMTTAMTAYLTSTLIKFNIQFTTEVLSKLLADD